MYLLAVLLMLVIGSPAHALTLELVQLTPDHGIWESTRSTSTYTFTDVGLPTQTYHGIGPYETGHILNPTEPVATIRAQIGPGGDGPYLFSAVARFLTPPDFTATSLIGTATLSGYYTLDGEVHDVSRSGLATLDVLHLSEGVAFQKLTVDFRQVVSAVPEPSTYCCC